MLSNLVGKIQPVMRISSFQHLLVILSEVIKIEIFLCITDRTKYHADHHFALNFNPKVDHNLIFLSILATHGVFFHIMFLRNKNHYVLKKSSGQMHLSNSFLENGTYRLRYTTLLSFQTF